MSRSSRAAYQPVPRHGRDHPGRLVLVSRTHAAAPSSTARRGRPRLPDSCHRWELQNLQEDLRRRSIRNSFFPSLWGSTRQCSAQPLGLSKKSAVANMSPRMRRHCRQSPLRQRSLSDTDENEFWPALQAQPCTMFVLCQGNTRMFPIFRDAGSGSQQCDFARLRS